MKTKQKTRALVVETRNREVAGGSLWAGRLLRQALSFYVEGGVFMDKLERRFNAWVDAHERELTVLMNSPEKWKFCEDFILPQKGRANIAI